MPCLDVSGHLNGLVVDHLRRIIKSIAPGQQIKGGQESFTFKYQSKYHTTKTYQNQQRSPAKRTWDRHSNTSGAVDFPIQIHVLPCCGLWWHRHFDGNDTSGSAYPVDIGMSIPQAASIWWSILKHLTFGGNSFEVYERFKKNLDHLEDPYRQASTMPLLLSSQDSPRVFDSDRHWNSMILRRAWHTHWDKALVVDDPHMAVVHPSPLDPAPQHPQHLASSPRVVHQV